MQSIKVNIKSLDIPVIKIEIAKEKGLFTYSDVLDGAIEKFTRRHPHVFGDVKVNNPEEALAVWKQMKKEEKELKKKNNKLNK